MPNQKNLYNLYNTLRDNGYTPPEFPQFMKDMEDDNNLRGAYDTLKREGYTPPEFKQFTADMRTSNSNPDDYQFDWKTGQWGFQKQEGQPIDFSAKAPNADMSLADIEGKKKKTPSGVRDTGLRSEDMDVAPAQSYGVGAGNEWNNRQAERRRADEEAGIRKEMELQGLDPDSEDDRAYYEETQNINKEPGEIGIDKWLKNQQALSDAEQRRREQKHDPDNPFDFESQGEWEDRLGQSVVATVTDYMPEALQGIVNLAKDAKNKVWEDFQAANANNPFAASPSNIFGTRRAGNVAAGEVEDDALRSGTETYTPTNSVFDSKNRQSAFGTKQDNKALNDYLNQTRERYRDVVKNVIDSADFQKRIAEDAEKLGYDKAFYETKVIDALNNSFVEQLRNELVRQQMPESAIGYILSGVERSITGTVLSRLSGTQGQWERRQEGIALYEAVNDPNAFTRGLNMGVGFAVDAPIFRGAGMVAGRATGAGVGLVNRARVANLVRAGHSQAEAARLLETQLANSFGRRVATNAMTGMLQSGLTLGTYESLQTATDQALAGYFDPSEILSSFGSGAQFGTTMGPLGALGGEFSRAVLGSATAQASNMTRILRAAGSETTKIAAETAGFTMAEQVGNLISGEDLLPWNEALGKSFATVWALKFSNPAGWGEIRKSYEYAFKPEKYDLENTNNYKMTKDQRAQLEKSASARNWFDVLQRAGVMFGRDTTPTERANVVNDAERAQMAVDLQNAYMQLMNDPEIDFVVKQKLAIIGGGLLQVKMPAVAQIDRTWNDRTKRGEVITRDANGWRIETRTFTDQDKMNEFADLQQIALNAEGAAAANNISFDPASWSQTYIDMRRRGMTYDELMKSQERIQRYTNALQRYYGLSSTEVASRAAVTLPQKGVYDIEKGLYGEQLQEVREAREEVLEAQRALTDADRQVMYRWADYTMGRNSAVYGKMIPIEAEIDGKKNTDMADKVVEATMKRDGKKVNVVKGYVASDKDGNIDYNRSNDTIIVKGEDGKPVMISPRDLAKVDSEMEESELLAESQSVVEDEVDSEMEKDASQPSGESETQESPYEIGERITLKIANADDTEFEVAEIEDDGTVVLQKVGSTSVLRAKPDFIESHRAETAEEEATGELKDGETVWLDTAGDGDLVDYVVQVNEDGTLTLNPADGVGKSLTGTREFIEGLVEHSGQRQNTNTEEKVPSAEGIDPKKNPRAYVTAKGGWEKMVNEENGVDITYDAVLEISKGNEERALAVLNGMLQQAEGALKKVKSSQKKLTGTPDEMAEQAEENEGRLKVAQDWVDFLKKAIDVPRRRKADAELNRLNAEQEQEKKRRAEAEQKRKEAEEKAKRDAEIATNQTKETTNEPTNEEGERPSLLDAVRTLYEKGKEVASRLYGRTYFNVVETPEFMKKLGLTGDKFTIRYGTISRHIFKDENHQIPVEVWEQLPDAIVHPFAITKYYENEEAKKEGKNTGYRVYTEIKLRNGFVVVGAEVKNAGKDMEVNSISTVFSREGSIGRLEDEVYRSNEITPEQASLLDEHILHQYPSEQESGGKGSNNFENSKENGGKNGKKLLKGETVQDVQEVAQEQEETRGKLSIEDGSNGTFAVYYTAPSGRKVLVGRYLDTEDTRRQAESLLNDEETLKKGAEWFANKEANEAKARTFLEENVGKTFTIPGNHFERSAKIVRTDDGEIAVDITGVNGLTFRTPFDQVVEMDAGQIADGMWKPAEEKKAEKKQLTKAKKVPEATAPNSEAEETSAPQGNISGDALPAMRERTKAKAEGTTLTEKEAKNLDVKQFVAKDKIRPTFSGVHYEDGYMTATDGHILIRVKANYPKEYEGKTIDPKTGEAIEGKYPNAISVLATPMGDNRTLVPVDIEKLRKDYALAKELQDGFKNDPEYVASGEKGKTYVELGAVMPKGHKFEDYGLESMGITTENIGKVLDVVDKVKNVELYMAGDQMYFVGDGVQGVVMGVVPPDGNGSSDRGSVYVRDGKVNMKNHTVDDMKEYVRDLEALRDSEVNKASNYWIDKYRRQIERRAKNQRRVIREANVPEGIYTEKDLEDPRVALRKIAEAGDKVSAELRESAEHALNIDRMSGITYYENQIKKEEKEEKLKAKRREKFQKAIDAWNKALEGAEDVPLKDNRTEEEKEIEEELDKSTERADEGDKTRFREEEDEDRSGEEGTLFSEREVEDDGTAERGPVVGREAVENTIQSLEGRLGHRIRRIEDKSEVRNPQALKKIEADEKRGTKRTKGWYDPATGEMVIYIPNCTGAMDAAKTVLHEIKGHKGLRSLLGKQFKQAMRDIYRMLPKEERKKIRESALDPRHEGWTIEVATEEYLARKAESNEKRPSWWRRALARIKAALRQLGFNVKFTDADINYLLWKAEDKLRAEGRTVFDRAEDISRRSQAEREAREETRRNAEEVPLAAREAEGEGEVSKRNIKKIIKSASKDGTLGKAPNGKPSRLAAVGGEELWARVRTPQFKSWFGDWEKVSRLRAIEKLSPINANKAAEFVEKQIGEDITRNKKVAQEFYKGMGTMQNKADMRKVRFTSESFKKCYRMNGLFFLKAIPAIKEAYENSILAYTDTKDKYEGVVRGDGSVHKQHENIRAYHNYVSKITIDGDEYYIRFTVKEDKGDNSLGHSMYVTDVSLYEKKQPPIPQSFPPLIRGEEQDRTADANLRKFFEDARKEEENCSKILDENGEPLVVYHGTTNDEVKYTWNENTRTYDTDHRPFTIFKRNVEGNENNGFWFSPDSDFAGGFGYNMYEEFLNMRNPLVVDCGGRMYNDVPFDGKSWIAYDMAAEAEKRGYDGLILRNLTDGADFATMEKPSDVYVVYKSNQIKNIDNDSPTESQDIRFREAEELAEIEAERRRSAGLRAVKAVEKAGVKVHYGEGEMEQKLAEIEAEQENPQYFVQGSAIKRGRKRIASNRKDGKARYIDFTRLDSDKVGRAFGAALKEYVHQHPDIKVETDKAEYTWSNYPTITFPNGSKVKVRIADHTKGMTEDELDNDMSNGIMWCPEYSYHGKGNPPTIKGVSVYIDISRNHMGAEDLMQFIEKLGEYDRYGFPEGLLELADAGEREILQKTGTKVPVLLFDDPRILQSFGIDVAPLEDAKERKLRSVNYHFNDELSRFDSYIRDGNEDIANGLFAGKPAKEHIFQLGMPSDALLSAGVQDLPLELSASTLIEKSSEGYKNNHPFSLESIEDLPTALAHPIAVFKSAKKGDNGIVILTDLKEGDDNFVVIVRRHNNVNDIEVNSVRSIYPKDSKIGIIKWVEMGLLEGVDKKKFSGYLSTQWPDYIAGQEIKPEIRNRLISVAKVVEDFDSTKSFGENIDKDGNRYYDHQVIRQKKNGSTNEPAHISSPEVSSNVLGSGATNNDSANRGETISTAPASRGKGSENFGTAKENGENILFRTENETPTRPSGPLREGEGIFDRAEAVSRDYLAELDRSRKEALAAMPKEEREMIQTRTIQNRVNAVMERLKKENEGHKQDTELVRKAVKELNGEMLGIRRAMTLQKDYDATTVKRILSAIRQYTKRMILDHAFHCFRRAPGLGLGCTTPLESLLTGVEGPSVMGLEVVLLAL